MSTIVGPEVVFGSYSGTNNKGFVANICLCDRPESVDRGCRRVGRIRSPSLRTKEGPQATWFRLSQLANRRRDRSSDGTARRPIHADVGRARDQWLLIPNTVRRSRRKTLAVSAFVIFFMLGFIVAFRGDRKSKQDLGIANTLNRTFVNFGTSAVCGFVAVDYTEKHGYYNGKLQLVPLAGIIPFGRRVFKMTDDEESSSAYLLTKLIMGRTGKGGCRNRFVDFCRLLFRLWLCHHCASLPLDGNRVQMGAEFLSPIDFDPMAGRIRLIGGVHVDCQSILARRRGHTACNLQRDFCGGCRVRSRYPDKVSPHAVGTRAVCSGLTSVAWKRRSRGSKAITFRRAESRFH